MKEIKRYKNKNLMIIIAMIVVVAVVFIIALSQNRKPDIAPDTRRIHLAYPLSDQSSTDADAKEPIAYVLCRLPSSNGFGLIPLPAHGAESYPVKQVFTDGTETENVLLLTPEGFRMQSSTCANQDCVHQGTVTLQNREDRVLRNSVICLPNQLITELYTAEEIGNMDLTFEDGVDDE